MKKSRFIKEVLTAKPEFSNTGTHFYITSATHILSGFSCEITPNGAYVWRFLYPCFDPSDEMHLLYSTRLPLPAGYIDFAKADRNNLAQEFINRIENEIPHAHELLTLEAFGTYCEGRPALLQHEHSQMVYGFTLLLLNENEKAMQFLEAATKHLRSPFREQVQETIDAMKSDPNAARKLVLRRAERTRKRLGN